MTAEEFAEKAKDQRQRGRLEEALVSARHAATLDPKNAKAFWQLALCYLDLNGAAEALEPLEKVTELAPWFASGWTKLGLALQETDEDRRAAECFERAIKLKQDDLPALLELASIYERDRQPDDEMRVLLRLGNHIILTPYQLNRLGILHHKKKEFHAAIRYYREVAAEGSGPAGFFNLGLVYNEPEMRQHADAVDAWRRALEREPEHEWAPKMIARLLPRLSELGQRVLATGGTVLDQDQWYSQYINPLELLKMDAEVGLEELDAKSLQRAKKMLLQEIDLEDGRVEWMPGLHIDRSRAISICDELNDDTKRGYHHYASQNKPLSAFLQRGDLRHFMVDDATSPLETVARLEDDPEGFGAWVSLRFAAQFDLVLTKAVEQQKVAAVECLLDGRRWVQPEDEDKCFDGAHRQVDRLLEPLRKAAESSPKTKPTLAGVQSVLSEGNMGEILGLLPVAFHKEKQEAATLMRSIAIDAYNHHDDADLAKAILQLSAAFASDSRSFQDQVNEDRATLDERIKAERQNEAHLRLGESDCTITREGVRVGSKFISVADVKTLRWGTIVTCIGYASSLAFEMAIGGPRGIEIKIKWTATQNQDAQRELFGKLINAALTYLVPPIVDVTRKRLHDHQRVRIGSVVLTKGGVEFAVQGWFTSKTVVCPWWRVKSEIKNGELVVFDPENRKSTTATLVLHEVDNAVVLHLLAQGA